MKTYDLVISILRTHPDTRSSDKRLIWKVWIEQGIIQENNLFEYISREDFWKAKSTETIRRCRQKIQQLHPELKPDHKTVQLRLDISNQKGTFIFRDKI
jgi:hypothetical protein